MSQKYLQVSHKKQCSYPSNMRLTAEFMDIECNPCGIFEDLSHPKEF